MPKLKWWHWVLVGFAVLIVIGVIAGDPEEDNGNGGGDEPAATGPADDEESAERESVEDRIRAGLEDIDPTEFGAVADSLDVKRIERLPRIVHVTLETPEGGFEGASVDDLDGSAAGTFKAVYEDAGWGKAATVTFEGGLVNTRTGKDLPNEETGIYRLEPNEARRIDWDNAIAVDWSLYRVFVHPAISEG